MFVKNEGELLENARTPELRRAREILIEAVNQAIAAVDPSSAMHRRVKLRGECLEVGDHKVDLSDIERLVVVGGGKATGKMAEVLEEILGERIDGGIVNILEGTATEYRARRVKLVEAGHPLPTKKGMEGAEEMMELVGELGEKDLVICLLSGGGSALMPYPVQGVSLAELRRTNELLLKSGAAIHEVNAVRKHLSRIKGGQLAKAARPARVISLIISDVVGDRLDTIASGPTYPDSTSFRDAMEVVERYGLTDDLPKSVVDHLQKGARGEIPETPKMEDEFFRNTIHEIIASNTDAVEAVAKVGRAHGLNVFVLTTRMEGEAREVGANIAAVARRVTETGAPVPRPALLISGGETTVTVRGEGPGGRNQELVLSAAIEISSQRNVAVTSFGTDGIDGPTDAAGALADGFTIERAKQEGLDPADHLRRNAPYTFFKKLGDLLFTGPTGTNVMDVAVLLVE
jgi:glycerate-2-kinase